VNSGSHEDRTENNIPFEVFVLNLGWLKKQIKRLFIEEFALICDEFLKKNGFIF